MSSCCVLSACLSFLLFMEAMEAMEAIGWTRWREDVARVRAGALRSLVPSRVSHQCGGPPYHHCHHSLVEKEEVCRVGRLNRTYLLASVNVNTVTHRLFVTGMYATACRSLFYALAGDVVGDVGTQRVACGYPLTCLSAHMVCECAVAVRGLSSIRRRPADVMDAGFPAAAPQRAVIRETGLPTGVCQTEDVPRQCVGVCVCQGA